MKYGIVETRIGHRVLYKRIIEAHLMVLWRYYIRHDPSAVIGFATPPGLLDVTVRRVRSK